MPQVEIRSAGSRSESSSHRLRAVRRVLGGEPASEVLGYSLERRHLASVAWGRGPLESLQLLAWELSGEPLFVELGEDMAWSWMQFSNGPEADIERRVRAFTPAVGWLALGSLAEGLEGFRESHLQALAAERVARISGATLTFYPDVALEALALEDVDAARRFVRHVLGDLVEDDLRARELRATLRAYFAAGQQALSAAMTLGVHERTVGHRIRAVEARLGNRPVTSVRAELELALRLHDLLS